MRTPSAGDDWWLAATRSFGNRTRIKNAVHAILQAHLIPPCPHADLFGRLGRSWLGRQELPDDERAAIGRHLRELDRLAEDLELLDREIAEEVIEDPSVKRLLTITGVTSSWPQASSPRSATSAASPRRRSS